MIPRREAIVTVFSAPVIDLLDNRVIAMITTLMPNGDPHSVIAGVTRDGDQLVSHTGPAARRLRNLRNDPRINVVAVDPANPMKYMEVRGTATLLEISGQKQMQGRFKEHAQKYALPEEAGEIAEGVRVVQIRITPHKVNFFDLQRSQMGPAAQQQRPTGTPAAASPASGGVDSAAATPISPDGVVRPRHDGQWIEFSRPIMRPAQAVWAALTDPRRLVLWQHPVEFIPELRAGATIYAQLNPQAGAVALGAVIELDEPRRFAFRWTTNNPQLPPDFEISYVIDGDELRVRSGPFPEGPGAVLLAASFHIHLDHLATAIDTPHDELRTPPWPQVSVVTRSGLMQATARAYLNKYPELAPQS
jgi:PPOX class probable F420-dependent enzyme